MSDLRFAIRNLIRNPRFALVTILTLAIGMGAATAIFSVTDWILFKASKFPADVFLIGGQNDQSSSTPTRFDFMVRAYTEQTSGFSEYAKAAYFPENIVLEGQPISTSWLGVSANLFSLLKITPRLGRDFLPGEDKEGSDDVAIISDQFWKKHFGAKADVLGQQIRIGESICTVVGVLREAQNLPNYFYSDVYRPLAYRSNPADPWTPNFFLLGRLRTGVTREQAGEMLRSLKVDVPAQMKAFLTNDHPVISSLAELNNSRHIKIYWVMVGAVGFLYAIACLNASNLILVRMLGQRQQHSIRLALGSSRAGLVKILLIDSLLVASCSSLIAVFIANWLFHLLLVVAGNPGAVPNWTSWSISWRALSVLGMLTLATSLLTVLVPAFRVLRTDLQFALKDGGNVLGESRALARLRGGFVIFQAVFAVILLTGAGLMIQTFQRLQKIDLGFDPKNRAKVQINFPRDYPVSKDQRLALLRTIQNELLHLPGVRAVGFGGDILLPGYYFAGQSLEGPNGTTLRAAMAGFNIGYPDAAGITLKQGHWLDHSTGNEILINESLARARWSGQNAVGQFLRPSGDNSNAPAEWKGWLVAGVVKDIRSTIRDAPGLYIYIPEGWGSGGFNSFILRLSKDYDEAFGGQIRRKLFAFDPRLIVSQIASLETLRRNQLWAENLANSVFKVLSAIALTLTIVGIFSVLAYTVDRRMTEFGVRMALGASRQSLVRLVMRRGILLTAMGTLLGIAGSLALTRLLQALLFETSPQDPWTFGIVFIVMILTSFFACILPSIWAAKANVAQLLRSQ